jgi:formylglycine-generating enzyme required for sulfatase activity
MVDGTPAMPHHRTRWRFPVLAAALALAAPTAAPAAEYAFLVGVGKYSTRELRELQYAEYDVGALYYALRGLGFDPNRIVVLSASVGAKDPRYFPNRKNILDEFDLLIRTLSERDSLLVALAGHGVQFEGEKDAYFCPADTDLSDRETLISLEKLYADLDLHCDAANKILLVDACRNDPQTSLSRSSRPTVKLESVTRPQELTLPRSLAAFYSCSPGQEAFEHPSHRQGLFFYHVVTGLKGAADLNKDGIVTLSELGDYVVPAVQDSSRVKVGKIQTPELRNARGMMQLVEVLPPSVVNSIGMLMKLIPADQFQMGSPKGEAGRDDDEMLHQVRILKPFYMGVYEVTQEEYELVMDTKPSSFSPSGRHRDQVKDLDTRHFPVENVSWMDAVEFCRRLSLRPEEQAARRSYRLPTEAEWEYACRAGTTTPFHFGTQLSGREANCHGDYPYGGNQNRGPFLRRTTRVGSYAPNRFGLYDMHGNVWEWCQDWYGPYDVSKVLDPTGAASAFDRVVRGGSWINPAAGCRSALRSKVAPASRDDGLGFRAVAVQAPP